MPGSLPKSTLYRAEVVVLRYMSLGEADRLLVLYSKDFGKFRASARGTRKTTSRMAGHLEPLTHSSLLLARGSSLDIISQAQTLKSFSQMRTDLGRISSSLYIAEIVDLFTEDDEPNALLFQLLLDTLDMLSSVDKSILHLIIHRFEMQLLGLMGYRPQFDACAVNGESLPQNVPLSFSVVWGGLLCENCSGRDGTARKISSRGVMILKILQRGNMEAVEEIEMTKEARTALSGLLRWYIQTILEREVQSGAFLDSLQ